MTRKDYVLIAETLRELLADIDREPVGMREVLTGERIGVRSAALRLAGQLQQENPRFEMGTFLKACGIAA